MTYLKNLLNPSNERIWVNSALKFDEWIRELFARHKSTQITWYDPYMEDAGINLINQYGDLGSNYLVYTSYPKEEPLSDCGARLLHGWGELYDKDMGPEPEPLPVSRIDNLRAACRNRTNTTQGVRLRVFGMPPDELDERMRMILIRDAELEPVAGYHLSCSEHQANGSFPHLITPIPHENLTHVMAYADDVITRSFTNLSTKAKGGDSVNPIIFDSDHL